MPEAALSLDREQLARVRHGAVLVTTAPAVFRIEGSGALTCLQGLLTNDLDRPGDHALVYGALLTPKGMIVADYWVLRQPDGFTLVGPREGRTATLELFSRRLPPRLARVTDLTDQTRAVWLLGKETEQLLQRASLERPEAAGRVKTLETADGTLLLALATTPAPFMAVAVGPEPTTLAFAARLVRAGATGGADSDLQAARILGGWPLLGAEIDERTLPQEVRYDDIGGVSYTKGCYVGQETVARLHFRGHTNRELRGLRWDGTAPLGGTGIMWRDKDVGAVRSTLALSDRMLGLGIVRREVATGEEVEAGGRTARIVALPFAPQELEA